MNSRYLLIPFALQMLAMAFDEFYFHWRRKLPRWERLGHPLDTLTVLICWLFLLLVRPSPTAVGIYAGLAIFSCLFVTKDEWVHKQVCEASENWLHAVLFILHPLMLLSAALLWGELHVDTSNYSLFNLIRYEGFESSFFVGNTCLTMLFGVYQLVYWNLLWKPHPKTQSITTSTTN
ncbi:MAG: hypothetical protein AB1757_11095 [Acidobacteriota bacterium]